MLNRLKLNRASAAGQQQDKKDDNEDELDDIEFNDKLKCARRKAGFHFCTIADIILHEDQLFTGSVDGVLMRWNKNLSADPIECERPEKAGAVVCMAVFESIGFRLAVAFAEKLAIYKIKKDSVPKLNSATAYPDNDPILSICQFGDSLCCGTNKGELYIRDMQAIHTRVGRHRKGISTVLKVDEDTVASGGLDWCIRIWKVSTKEQLVEILEFNSPVLGIKLDDTIIMAASSDGSVLAIDCDSDPKFEIRPRLAAKQVQLSFTKSKKIENIVPQLISESTNALKAKELEFQELKGDMEAAKRDLNEFVQKEMSEYVGWQTGASSKREHGPVQISENLEHRKTATTTLVTPLGQITGNGVAIISSNVMAVPTSSVLMDQAALSSAATPFPVTNEILLVSFTDGQLQQKPSAAPEDGPLNTVTTVREGQDCVFVGESTGAISVWFIGERFLAGGTVSSSVVASMVADNQEQAQEGEGASGDQRLQRVSSVALPERKASKAKLGLPKRTASMAAA